jgi:hypothetical protein
MILILRVKIPEKYLQKYTSSIISIRESRKGKFYLLSLQRSFAWE